MLHAMQDHAHHIPAPRYLREDKKDWCLIQGASVWIHGLGREDRGLGVAVSCEYGYVSPFHTRGKKALS